VDMLGVIQPLRSDSWSIKGHTILHFADVCRNMMQYTKVNYFRNPPFTKSALSTSHEPIDLLTSR
jgi:hypothetical protein